MLLCWGSPMLYVSMLTKEWSKLINDSRPNKQYNTITNYLVLFCCHTVFMRAHLTHLLTWPRSHVFSALTTSPTFLWSTIWSAIKRNIAGFLTCLPHMWPDLPKPATYAHNGKEHFSSPIDRSINKLTNCHNTTAASWLVCFSEICFWGLSDVHECSGVHWVPLIGLYRQPPCWKSPPDLFMM